ncbi:MAG: zinc-ribbon domain-containing protein [Clostridiales bacterium]|jgi:hypothetical protein|nr:zinc-ribbon domain-containing protein [Clostridiales bacterium]
MFCPNCGTKIGEAAKFCPACGGAVATKPVPQPEPVAAEPVIAEPVNAEPVAPAATTQEYGYKPNYAAPVTPVSAPAADCPGFKKSIIAAVLALIASTLGLGIAAGSVPVTLDGSVASVRTAGVLMIVGALIALPCSIVAAVLGLKASKLGKAGRGVQRKALPAYIIGLIAGIYGIIIAVTAFSLFFGGIGLSL